jgi:YibE/F-like protein
MRGLLLAGILIGALGVLDDATVTQAVAVTELAQANPELTGRQLYRAASRVGRATTARSPQGAHVRRFFDGWYRGRRRFVHLYYTA